MRTDSAVALPLWYMRAHEIAAAVPGVAVQSEILVSQAYHHDVEYSSFLRASDALGSAGIYVEFINTKYLGMRLDQTSGISMFLMSPRRMVECGNDDHAYKLFKWRLALTSKFRISNRVFKLVFPDVDEWGLNP